MSDFERDTPTDAPLNPALKTSRDTTHDTKSTTPPPFDTASAKEGEGEGWPIVWAVATLVGIALALYFLT